MNVKLLTEDHLEFLSLKGGCTVSSESTRVKIPHCWKSHVMAHILLNSADTYTLLTDAFQTETLEECTFCKSPENGYNSPETPNEVIDHIFYKGYSVIVSMQKIEDLI